MASEYLRIIVLLLRLPTNWKGGVQKLCNAIMWVRWIRDSRYNCLTRLNGWLRWLGWVTVSLFVCSQRAVDKSVGVFYAQQNESKTKLVKRLNRIKITNIWHFVTKQRLTINITKNNFLARFRRSLAFWEAKKIEFKKIIFGPQVCVQAL